MATMATERLTLMAVFKVNRIKHMNIKVYLVPHPLGFCCLSIVSQVCKLTVYQSPIFLIIVLRGQLSGLNTSQSNCARGPAAHS